MTNESGDGRVRVLEDAAVWARAHPALFFRQAQPSLRELREMLLIGARTLGAGRVEDLSSGDWHVVAASEDWLARGAALEAGRSLFHSLHAFPELGQNSSRPEFLVHAFAEQVVSHGPEGASTIKGVVDFEGLGWWAPVLAAGWRRVVAFRGLDR